MRNFGHLAQRLFNTPLMIHPKKADVIMAALADRLHIARVPVAYADDDDFDFERPATRGGSRDPGYDMVGPVAVIPVVGTLVQRTGSLRPQSGITGYDGLRLAFFAAMEDPAVKAVVFDVDSPGGEVAGCFDLCDQIFAARGRKPMWSILSENAFSAGYALASAADKVIVPRTGGTGSIGIVYMHVDWSRAVDEAGLKVTMIHYGSRKVDGHPELPLSDRARESMQSDIDALGDLFVKTVARQRALPAAKVRETEAGTYLGARGVAAGLADAVAAPSDAFQRLVASLSDQQGSRAAARRH